MAKKKEPAPPSTPQEMTAGLVAVAMTTAIVDPHIQGDREALVDLAKNTATEIESVFHTYVLSLAAELTGYSPRLAAGCLDICTPRELQVATLMASGMRNSEIARKLGISTRTLDIHRAHLARKLAVPGTRQPATCIVPRTIAGLLYRRLYGRVQPCRAEIGS